MFFSDAILQETEKGSANYHLRNRNVMFGMKIEIIILAACTNRRTPDFREGDNGVHVTSLH